VILGLTDPVIEPSQDVEMSNIRIVSPAKSLNVNAKSWFPKTESSNLILTDWPKNNEIHTDNESKTGNKTYLQKDRNVRSPTSPLVLPVFCTPPARNGGLTFFADGRDQKAYNLLQPNDNKALSFLDHASLPRIYSQVKHKTKKLIEIDSRGIPGQWMFFDSGASRTGINSQSPLRSLLTQVEPTTGSCTVGSGVKLPYMESGILVDHNPVTVVEGLQFDLYSAVAAAKRGTSAVIDIDFMTGENKSSHFVANRRGIPTC
jgi:hypothetical protein